MSGAGWDGQVAYAPEGTFGVFTTPTRALEHVKSGLKSTRVDKPSGGIKAGRRNAHRYLRGVEVVAGPISHELSSANVALLVAQWMGAVNTTGGPIYAHACTDGPLTETRGISVQVGVPMDNGTVTPENFSGCQIVKGKITVKAGDTPVMLDLDWVGQHMQSTGDGDVVTALTTAVYPSTWMPFTGLNAVLTIAGSEFEFDDLTFDFDNALRTGQYTARSTNPGRARPSKESGRRVKRMSIKSDLWDLTAMNRAIAGTEVAASLVLTSGTHIFTIAGNVHSQVTAPTLEGLQRTKDALNLEFVSGTSDPAGCTITVTNGDSTP